MTDSRHQEPHVEAAARRHLRAGARILASKTVDYGNAAALLIETPEGQRVSVSGPVFGDSRGFARALRAIGLALVVLAGVALPALAQSVPPMGGVNVVASPLDSGMRSSHTLSAASNNATVVKSTAGTLGSLVCINTTATIYYLKLYDKATTPAPASDSVKHTYPCPASTSGAGFVVPLLAPMTFANGIGFALVGAIGDTDNSNAATGVAVEIEYR